MPPVVVGVAVVMGECLPLFTLGMTYKAVGRDWLGRNSRTVALSLVLIVSRRLVFQVLKRLAGRADVAMPKVCRGKVCGS